jgi:hypothetical protein
MNSTGIMAGLALSASAGRHQVMHCAARWVVYWSAENARHAASVLHGVAASHRETAEIWGK